MYQQLLFGRDSWICSKHGAVFSCGSLIAFFSSHTVLELIQLQIGRILVLFYERSDSHMVDNQSISDHIFPMCLLTLLSVDEILQPGYVNWSSYFRDLPFNVKMVPSCLKLMNSVLSFFKVRSMRFVDCSRLCSKGYTWADIPARSTRSSE